MIIKKLITEQDGDNLGRYFNEIKKYESLTKEEEKELIKRIQKTGDKAALDKLVKGNIKFVISVAKGYQGQGVPLMDLIAEGNTGLLAAVKRFDTERDLKFFSYAVWWIRIKIFTSMDFNKRLIQLPANRELLVQRVKKEVNEMEQVLNRLPSLDELVIKLKDFNRSDIAEAITFFVQPHSLSDTIGSGDSETTLEEITGGNMDIDDTDRQNSITDELNRYLVNLNQKEYDVMVLSIGLNQEPPIRNADVAVALGVKEKDIPNIKTRAMKRLRGLKNINSLKDFL